MDTPSPLTLNASGSGVADGVGTAVGGNGVALAGRDAMVVTAGEAVCEDPLALFARQPVDNTRRGKTINMTRKAWNLVERESIGLERIILDYTCFLTAPGSGRLD
jgi:hypothetical protein